MTTTVGGFYVRREERTLVCLTASPDLTLLVTLSIFDQVKIFRDFPKRWEKRVLFNRFSPSLSIPSCCPVYESLISKAVGKAGNDLGKKTEGQMRGILCGFCLLTISVGELLAHC